MSFVVVDGNEQFVEEELVEHSAYVLGRLPVGVSRVLGDIECDADEFVGFGEVGIQCAKASFRGGEFGVEAFLLGAEHVDSDCVVVVGFEEFPLAALDGLSGSFELFPFGVGVGSQRLQSVAQQLFEVTPEALGEADAVIEVLDEVFDVVDLDGAEGTFSAFGVSAEA